MNRDGSKKRRLFSSKSWLDRPQWSPDGTRIAFGVGYSDDVGAHVAVLSVADGSLARIDNASSPTWSPTGKRLAFLSDQPPEYRAHRTTLSVSAPDGSSRRVVLRREGGFRYPPVWSPVGESIALPVYSSGFPLFTLGVDSGLTRDIAPDGYFPSWSPDGKKLAFTNNMGVWASSAIRPSPRRLVGGFARLPSWSPDGSRIACVTSTALLVVSAKGGRATVVARNARGFDGPPVWIRDGRRLIYEGRT
jgi:Tol biopolymer transport system component